MDGLLDKDQFISFLRCCVCKFDANSVAQLNEHIIEVHTIKGEILGSDDEVEEVELNLRFDSADEEDFEEDFDLEILEQRMEVEGLFPLQFNAVLPNLFHSKF